MLFRIGKLLFSYFTFLLLVFPFYSLAQKTPEKNPYVKYSANQDEENYIIDYTFKDHYNNFQNYQFALPIDYTQSRIVKFGVPLWLFEPYVGTEYNLRIRKKEMKEGLFLLNDNVIEVDKSTVLEYYSESFCQPIAKMIVESLADYGRDTRRDRIEMAIRFVQDIPYGIPTYSDKDKHYGGVSPPPKLLLDGYGDCDSKVLLFAGILIYLIPAEDIIFLNQSDHVLSAIQDNPRKGDTYINYKHRDYLIAETAGPGKRMLGQKGNYYKTKFKIEPLRLESPSILPYSENDVANKPAVNPEIVDNKTLVIKNPSEREFRFQLSFDNSHWKDFYLQSEHSGKYVFEEDQHIYLRYRERNSRFAVYKIQTGNAYVFRWDSRKRRWEPQG